MYAVVGTPRAYIIYNCSHPVGPTPPGGQRLYQRQRRLSSLTGGHPPSYVGPSTVLVVVGLLYDVAQRRAGSCTLPYGPVQYPYCLVYSSRRDQGQRYRTEQTFLAEGPYLYVHYSRPWSLVVVHHAVVHRPGRLSFIIYIPARVIQRAGLCTVYYGLLLQAGHPVAYREPVPVPGPVSLYYSHRVSLVVVASQCLPAGLV